MSDLHVFAIAVVAVLVVSGVGLWTTIHHLYMAIKGQTTVPQRKGEANEL
jgi:hypothetical protein